jgi:predicted small secreted protein
MQKLFKITVLLVVIVSLVITSCSSSKGFSKKGQCGCPSKTGMVGY